MWIYLTISTLLPVIADLFVNDRATILLSTTVLFYFITWTICLYQHVVRSTSRLYVILVYHLPSLFVGPIEAYSGDDLAKHWYICLKSTKLTSITPSSFPVALGIHDSWVFVYILVSAHTSISACLWFVENLDPSLVVTAVTNMAGTYCPMAGILITEKTAMAY